MYRIFYPNWNQFEQEEFCSMPLAVKHCEERRLTARIERNGVIHAQYKPGQGVEYTTEYKQWYEDQQRELQRTIGE